MEHHKLNIESQIKIQGTGTYFKEMTKYHNFSCFFYLLVFNIYLWERGHESNCIGSGATIKNWIVINWKCAALKFRALVEKLKTNSYIIIANQTSKRETLNI